MNAGDYVYTPRFLRVKIEEVFDNCEEASKQGYTEPTHYKGEDFDILGKGLDCYHMQFAAVKKM